MFYDVFMRIPSADLWAHLNSRVSFSIPHHPQMSEVPCSPPPAACVSSDAC